MLADVAAMKEKKIFRLLIIKSPCVPNMTYFYNRKTEELMSMNPILIVLCKPYNVLSYVLAPLPFQFVCNVPFFNRYAACTIT
jgi:hypothetical protein